MSAGKYKLREFLTNDNLDQIIIPEIQRDYVWKRNNVKILLESISDNSKQQKENHFCNIGFIYAYYDKEMANRYILIDGQQRITTLFLLLLALYVKQKRQDDFKGTYFKDSILKFDYKVRETSHEFLPKFVEYILKENNIADVPDTYWYFSEYENDVTIKSILSNYKVINDFIQENDLSLDYVENHIEFWYFDTNNSKQGEELYLYMNSRGEAVSPNESIKANLIKSLSEGDKTRWGEKWEEWQNLFWKHRKIQEGKQTNSDKGIEEFLKWIKFIESIACEKGKSSDELVDLIKKIKKEEKSIKELNMEIIENYYKALEKIIDIQNNLDLEFKENWLAGDGDNDVEYIKILPMLMYVKKYPDCIPLEVKRFARFFINIAKFAKKSDDKRLVEIIIIANQFLDNDLTDITDIEQFSSENKELLTDEEVRKLLIYRKNSDELRNQIEKTFWEAEEHHLCNGKIEFIWECIDYNNSEASKFDKRKLSDFKECFNNFKTLLDKPTDLVRRALLTKGDYKVWDGRISKLGWLNRYSFSLDKLKEQLTSEQTNKPYKQLIIEYGNKKEKDKAKTKEDILKQIIGEYLKSQSSSEKNWRYYFIKEEGILSSCKNQMVSFPEDESKLDEIFLLKGKKISDENSYNSLLEFLNP